MENNFELLIIKPNMIDHLDYNKVDYISELTKMNCYETVESNEEDIGIVFAKYLNQDNYIACNAQTNICYETKDYLYEICYLDIPKEKKNNDTINQLATLLDITNEQIFGNAILIKTYLPISSSEMKIISSNKDDIKTILESRVNHKGVFIDTDKSLKQLTYRDLKVKLRELFDEEMEALSKIEIPFLKHNFIMFYNKDSLDEENTIVRDIAQKKINGEVFIISMVTNTLFTDILVDEVKKMLDISKFGESAWKSNPDDDKEERDDKNRIIIKSKYRILYNKHNQLLNLD